MVHAILNIFQRYGMTENHYTLLHDNILYRYVNQFIPCESEVSNGIIL